MAGLLPLEVFHSSSWLKNAIGEQILILFLHPVDVRYKYKEMLEEKSPLLLCSSFAALWIQIVLLPSCNTCNRVHKVDQNIPYRTRKLEEAIWYSLIQSSKELWSVSIKFPRPSLPNLYAMVEAKVKRKIQLTSFWNTTMFFKI